MGKYNYIRFCRICEEQKPAYAKNSKQCKDCVDKKMGKGHPLKGKKLVGKYQNTFEKAFGMKYSEYKDQLNKAKKEGLNVV